MSPNKSSNQGQSSVISHRDGNTDVVQIGRRSSKKLLPNSNEEISATDAAGGSKVIGHEEIKVELPIESSRVSLRKDPDEPGSDDMDVGSGIDSYKDDEVEDENRSPVIM